MVFGSFVQPALAQLTFGAPLDLSNNLGDSRQPEIAAVGTNAYAVWFDNSPGNFDILFARSTDSGSNFGSPVNLSNNPGTSVFPKIAADGSNVYVVWSDNSPGTFDILFARSTDGGATFGSPVNLSGGVGFSFQPKIITSGSNIFVIWGTGCSVLFVRSADNGASFSSPINLSNGVGCGTSPADIAASNGNLDVVFRSGPASDIFLVRSTDNGASFNSPVNVSNDADEEDFPQVAASGNNVFVVWRNIPHGNTDIFFTRSTDGGATFGIPVNLSNDAGLSELAQIAASGNNVFVTWRDGTTPTGYSEIFFARSTDDGSSFSTANISNTSGDSIFPDLALSGNDVFVAWEDTTGLTAGNADAYIAASTDNAASFDTPINLGSIPGESREPQVTAASNNVYVGWSESESEIYFVSGTIETTVNPISVGIDIKPGSSPNAINPEDMGVIPVAILTTGSFDASVIDPSTIKFGPNNADAVKSSLQDVDGDGDLDMVLHFKTQQTGIACGQTSATLKGQTLAGIPIEGSDSIKVIPCQH